jgi:hypothetical protein
MLDLWGRLKQRPVERTCTVSKQSICLSALCSCIFKWLYGAHRSVLSHHGALALDLHTARACQSISFTRCGQQLVSCLADLYAAEGAGGLHAGRSVHGIAKQAKLGGAVANDARGDGAGVDANAHGDGLTGTRLERARCLRRAREEK